MIKRFRPFWSYDILQTEAWLYRMSLSGYHLKTVRFASRIFVFEQGEAKTVLYRLCYDWQFDGQAPAQLLSAGWEYLCSGRRFYVLRAFAAYPPVVPPYDAVLRRNRKIRLTAGISALTLAILGLPLLALAGALLVFLFTGELIEEETISQSPPLGFILSGVLLNGGSLFFFIWSVFTFLCLGTPNKQLERMCPGIPQMDYSIPTAGLMSPAAEKEMFKSKTMIRKRKIAWFYSPDKAERWLEKMEDKGFNLYRMSKIGNSFYFIKGAPRKMRYAIDYQKTPDAAYFIINTECGWKLIFSSVSKMQAITVWSHEYAADGSVPEFYSDEQSKLKHAKTFALTYSLIFFPLCALYIGLIVLQLFIHLSGPLDWMLVATYTLLIAEYSLFAFKTVFYYLRIKKKLND